MPNKELKKEARVILYAIRKGGTGKTHTATHHAFYLSQIKHRKVLFIELDGQRNGADVITKGPLGELSNVTSDLLFSSSPLPALIDCDGVTVIAPKDKNFDLIDRSDNSLIGNFQKRIAELKPQFDDIIIDTPPSTLLRVNASLVVSNFVISPMEISEVSLDGVRDHVAKIDHIRKQYNPSLVFLGMVLNKYDSRISIDKVNLGKLITTYKGFIFNNVMKDRKAPYKQALQDKVPVWEVSTSAALVAREEMFKVFEEAEERMQKAVKK